MARLRRHFLRLVMAALAIACGVGQARGDAAPSGDLTFRVVPEQAEYTRAGPIEVRFQLENHGTAPVYVNTRFKLGPPAAAKAQREVWLAARAPSGQPLKSTYPDVPTGFPKSQSFERLAPGGKVLSERAVDLKTYFDFPAPGTYRLVATYENVFGRELGLDAVRTKRTAEVLLTLVE